MDGFSYDATLESLAFARERDMLNVADAMDLIEQKKDGAYLDSVILDEYMTLYGQKVEEGLYGIGLYEPLIESITGYLESMGRQCCDMWEEHDSFLSHLYISHYRLSENDNLPMRSKEDVYISYKEISDEARHNFSLMLMTPAKRRLFAFRYTPKKDMPLLGRSCRHYDTRSFTSALGTMLKNHMLDGGRPGYSVGRVPYMLQRLPDSLTRLGRDIDASLDADAIIEEMENLKRF